MQAPVSILPVAPRTVELPRLSVAMMALCLALGVQAFLPMDQADPLSMDISLGRLLEPLLLAAAVALLGGTATRAMIRDAFTDRGFFLFSLFCLWAAISAAWSPSPLRSAVKAAELWSLAFITGMLIAHARHRQLWPVGLARAAAVALLLVLAGQFVFNLAINGELLSIMEGATATGTRARLSLGYTHPLTIGDLTALAVMLIICSRIAPAWRWPLAAGCGVLLVLTDSRAAIVGLGGSLLLMGLALFSDPRRRLAALCAALLALVVVVAAVDLPLHRWMPSDAQTLNGRTELWTHAAGAIQQHLWFGTGYYSARFYLMEAFPWAGHLHNAYLEVVMTLGTVGALLALAYVAHITRVAIQTRSPLLIGVGTYAVFMALTGPSLFAPNAVMLVLLLAVGHADLIQRLAVNAAAASPKAPARTAPTTLRQAARP